MGWREFCAFMNRPVFLSKRAKEKLAFESEEYRALRDKLEQDEVEAAQREAQYSDELARLTLKDAGLVRDLKESRKRVSDLEKELSESISALSLGRHILSDSTTGLLAFDKDLVITDVNEALCRYIQVEKPDLVGDTLKDLQTVETYFNIYSHFVGLVAGDDSEIKPNKFKILGVVFDIMGYTDEGGGHILLAPLEERGMREKVFGAKAIEVIPEVPITRDNVGREILIPSMAYTTKNRYINFVNSSITRDAIGKLAEFYQCVTNQRDPKENFALILSNVSAKEREYLIEAGINGKHIRGIRKEQSLEGNCLSNPEPQTQGS